MEATETTTSSEEVLKDEGMVQVEGQTTEPVSTANQPAETTVADPAPTLSSDTLEGAMRAFNAAKSKAAEANVSTGEATVADGGGVNEDVKGSGAAAQPSTAGAVLPDTTSTAVVTEGGSPSQSTEGEGVQGGVGELTGNDEVYDPAAGIAEVRRDLIERTQNAVRAEFAKQKKNKISVNDLVKVDAERGTKEFINPDTGRPFQSSNPRSEAQAFVRDYNAELDEEFRQLCQQVYPNVEKSFKPILDFHEFLPTWMKMDEFRKEMWEDLVKGHELVNAQGEIEAYDLDLNATYNLMERQVQWLLAQQKELETKEATPVTQPAVAAKTATATVKEDDKVDLGSVEGALRYYNKTKKK